jgi:predicted lipid-binding transport protein (Tim44 family)
MLGVESNSIEHVASVRFTGMIREEEQAPAQNFSEIWVLTKPLAGSQGWLLAGIQQA